MDVPSSFPSHCWTQYSTCSLNSPTQKGRMSSIDLLATFPKATQEAVGLLHTKAAQEAAGSLCTRALAHLQPGIHQSPKMLFCRAAAPACTTVDVYPSLDFGLCNISQKNREKSLSEICSHRCTLPCTPELLTLFCFMQKKPLPTYISDCHRDTASSSLSVPSGHIM